MTNDELQGHIKAIEAAVEAGEIEENDEDDDVWGPCGGGMVVLGSGARYRIKPKPLECWVIRHNGMQGVCTYRSEDDARSVMNRNNLSGEPVLMREVTK